MTTSSIAMGEGEAETRNSWVPMIAIALGQVLMSFNVASLPALAEVAEIEAHSPFRLPSPSLQPGQLVEVARRIERGFASGFDGAVVIQGTDTIEESAFLLDLLIGDENSRSIRRLPIAIAAGSYSHCRPAQFPGGGCARLNGTGLVGCGAAKAPDIGNSA